MFAKIMFRMVTFRFAFFFMVCRLGKKSEWLLNLHAENCDFVYETVASCGVTCFLDLFNVCGIFGPQGSAIGGYVERACESR